MSPDLANRLAREQSSYPLLAEAIPKGSIRVGRYVLRFARTASDLEAVQRLRFAVFNLELAEGLQSAYATGRDEDAIGQRGQQRHGASRVTWPFISAVPPSPTVTDLGCTEPSSLHTRSEYVPGGTPSIW